MAFIRVSPGDPVRADDINDIQKALDGSAGKAQAISFTELDDAANHALNVRNKDGTNSLIARFRNAANEVVLGIVKEALTTAKQIISTVADGTAPLVVASTTKVDNLHVARATLADTIANGAVTADKIGTGAVTAGKIADGGVDTTARMANDIVDDTKVGNRVPALTRRQGGDASIWSVAGSTNRTPEAVRMQAGCIGWTGAAASSGTVTVTFPVAFSMEPLVYAMAIDPLASPNAYVVHVLSVGSSSCSIQWYNVGGGTKTSIAINWYAIGPE